jgi:class 3 adenylate cyclase
MRKKNMVDTGTRNGLAGWLQGVPESVPQEMGRYFSYWKVFYFLGGCSHAMALVMFALTGVTFMAVFNIFSISIFFGAYFILQRGYFRTAFWAVNAELIAHGMAATVCVGPLYSFQNFVFLVVIFSFIQPFYSRRFSALLAGGAIFCGTATMLYMIDRAPIYDLDSRFFIATTVAIGVVVFPMMVLAMVLPFIDASARAEKEITKAYGESESLLLNILPEPIAAKLKSTKGMIAENYERVAILFADIVGFTRMSDQMQPAEVVTLLNELFNTIDEIVEKYGVEKIKTIGDAYMVVAGLPNPMKKPEETIALLALDIQSAVAKFREPGTENPVRVRIGINSGRVVAGVIGHQKFAYDLWGDAVNIAARMEATGVEGKIQVTDAFAQVLADGFEFEPRGEIEVKGKGRLRTSFLLARKK